MDCNEHLKVSLLHILSKIPIDVTLCSNHLLYEHLSLLLLGYTLYFEKQEISVCFISSGVIFLSFRRGISNFYAGKSKSFTSLSHAASSSSLNDIVKPENAYTRKRKNLLAHNNFFSKNHNQNSGGGLYKRPTNSRSSLALAATQERFPLPSQARRSGVESSSPPTPKQKFCGWRSFSLFDLQGVGDGTLNLTGTKE